MGIMGFTVGSWLIMIEPIEHHCMGSQLGSMWYFTVGSGEIRVDYLGVDTGQLLLYCGRRSWGNIHGSCVGIMGVYNGMMIDND